MASIFSHIRKETTAATINIITRGDVNWPKNILNAEFLSFDWIAFGQYFWYLKIASLLESQFSDVWSSSISSENSIW